MFSVCGEAVRRNAGWSESGTAAIEFALMTPFLVILLGGVVEFGLATYEKMQVNTAVEAGILYAAANPADPTLIHDVGVAVTGAGYLPAGYTTPLAATPAPTQFCGCPSATGLTQVACSVTCTGGVAHGTYVQVNASLNHLILLPTSFGLPTSFSATAVIRIN